MGRLDKRGAEFRQQSGPSSDSKLTTYIWLLTNAKPEARRGKVQLIDASLLFRKLRKNLGDKNCEFAPEHIEEITAAYLAFRPVKRQLDANGNPTGIAVQI